MKESKETPLRYSGDGKSRGRHMSSSSRRSIRSNASTDSHRSLNVRNLFRGRRPSQSSTRSQALVDDSDASSVASNAVSRKTSHADDSDASGTDESLGETEEDVWFRDDIHPDGDINVDELDQLLNLSDEDSIANAYGQRGLDPGAIDRNALQQQLQEHKLNVRQDAQNEAKKVAHNVLKDYPKHERASQEARQSSGPQARNHEISSYEDVDEKSHLVAEKPEHTTHPGSLLLSNHAPTKQFVKYTPAVANEKQGYVELGIQDEFDSSGSSENKEPYLPDPNEKPIYTNPSPPLGEDPHSDLPEAPLGCAQPSPNPLYRNSGRSNAGATDGAGGAASKRADPTAASAATATPSAGISPDDGVNQAAEGPEDQSQRFSFYAAGMESTIHATDLASLVGENESFSSLFNPKNGTWFLDCFRPTQVEMRALSRAFGIHPLTTEDIQTEEAREKFEKFNNYYLVVYHTFESDEENEKFIDPINFYILVFNEGVISFHFEPVSHCRNVRRRMRQLRDHLSFTSDWVAYALIDDITDSFAPQIHAVEKEADFVEDAVYLDRSNAGSMHVLLKRLGEGRRMTMHLLRMLAGKADVVRGFAKRCGEVHSAAGNEMALYLGDIQDHIVTMYQNLSAYEKIFSRTHFNYMGLLQMEFVDSSNQMTSVLGKVTVIGTVLVPLNLVTGLFGMNVKVPGQDGDNLHWFFGILAVMIAVVLLLLGVGFWYVRYSMRENR